MLVDEIVRPLEEKLNAELEKSSPDPGENDPTDACDDWEAGEIPARRSEASRLRQRPQSVGKGASGSAAVEHDPASLITQEELEALIGDEVELGDNPNTPIDGEEH